MTSWKRRRRLGVLTAATFLLAVACGGDDDTAESDATTTDTDLTSSSPPTQDTEAPEETDAPDASPSESTGGASTESPESSAGAPAGTPVTVAVIYPETGGAGSSYNNVDAVSAAWQEWVNSEQGGVNGHPVEVVALDMASTGDGATAAVREAVEELGAVAVVVFEAGAEAVVVEYLDEAGVPTIGGSSHSRPIDGTGASWPNSRFLTSSSPPPNAAWSILSTQAVGLTSFAAAVCAEYPPCQEAGQLYEAIGGAVGVDYTGLVTVGAADPTFTAPCLALIQQGADVIGLSLAASTALSVLEECQLQGFEGAFAACCETVAGSLSEIEGLRLIGGVTGFPWWADAEPVNTFNDVMEAYGDGTDVRSPSATMTWSTLELFRTAMNEYGPTADVDVTSADVIAAYHQIDGETLDGLLPSPISFVEEGPQPVVACAWLFELNDGTFSTITFGESGNGATGDLQSSCMPAG